MQEREKNETKEGKIDARERKKMTQEREKKIDARERRLFLGKPNSLMAGKDLGSGCFPSSMLPCLSFISIFLECEFNTPETKFFTIEMEDDQQNVDRFCFPLMG